ncbi:Sec-independent protein translocase subunit TatA [Streptomyces sp. KPB2]|uniref:Sec-independent protein translocase subunit TatA n=1 Tax=Streptomyces TaxID=1883 RepID=UPI000F720BA9|nr:MULTISPECIES: Sec-independent protein translocase subunit TatA [Streptomyces]AZM79819.1 Sec-independent protein translocase subunit TatA [Streptomyces sp. KPB2]MDU0251755.1 Sec-independent protein translocase subunit TatA [Streptomyces sp. PU10]QKW65449.1 Sec-independent protein translocase subunit TatA [Streptomyces sp. NA03103]
MLRNGLEPWHLLIVAIVTIALFGSKKLPETARALGKSMRILKSEAKAMKGDEAAPSAAAGDASTPTAAVPRVSGAAQGEVRPAAGGDSAR